MKFRVNEHSVRLRLRKSEVRAFAENGSVWSTLHMPGGRSLTYGLAAASVEQMTVSSTGDRVEVLVPRAQGELWSSSDQVGIYGRHEAVDILIEKDFRRTSVPSPDDEDRYPNPRARE